MKSATDAPAPPGVEKFDPPDCRAILVGGRWIEPDGQEEIPIVNPADERPVGLMTLGTPADVDRAVAAARAAAENFAATPVSERLALLERIGSLYSERAETLARAVSLEMGAPLSLARGAQVPAGLAHLQEAARLLAGFSFERVRGATRLRHEPIGVCGLITPWNWPLNQIACKVAPALAAGCTMVLKPSESAPFSARLMAEILHDAGVPAGVFNLIQGRGASVGAALAAHADVDMISFTGSTRAGVAVAQAAAPTVKRVVQELGGKAAYVVLDDADFEWAVGDCVRTAFRNGGQSCNAPARLLVPAARLAEATAVAQRAAQAVVVGDPLDSATTLGPLANGSQFDKVQRLIASGVAQGAALVAGGTGRPEGIARGFFVRPTIFTRVTNAMQIGCEEIFGPVLAILPHGGDEDAVRQANDTRYGLANFIASRDPERARRVARRLRSGNVHLNGARVDFAACFGGYKQSGNGREWGAAGLAEFLELKAILGGG